MKHRGYINEVKNMNKTELIKLITGMHEYANNGKNKSHWFEGYAFACHQILGELQKVSISDKSEGDKEVE